MRRPKRHELALTATGAGAWLARMAADRRAIHADPGYADLHAPLHGETLAVASSDGTPLRVVEFGARDAPKTVVLVHGWTCALRIWTRQIRALAGDDVRIVAYDLRGHGQSGRPEEPDYSIEAHALDLDAVLRAALRDGERAVVAGHSLGAMTIVAWAGQHPEEVAERIEGALLVNTGMDALVSESPMLPAPRQLAKARDLMLSLALGAAMPLPRSSTPLSYRTIRWIALSRSASPAEIAFCERIVLACNRDVRARCGITLSGLDVYESLASLTVPTIVLGSEDDMLTAPSHVRRLADALPNVVEEFVIPDCGHMSLVSRPDVVTARLRRLLGEPR